MRDKWEKKIREELEEDTNRLMEQVNNDPALKDVEAPEEIHTKLMQQIRDYEASKNPVDERLTAEERELIQLGKVYKKTRRFYRYAIAAAAVVTVLAVGITSVGGPQKVIRVVRDFVNSRDWLQIDVDKERISETGATAENEAFLEIEETFKTKTVSLRNLPKDMKFVEYDIDEKLQKARLVYEGDEETLMFQMLFQYRSTSAGVDVEDELKQKYEMDVNNHKILIKQYDVEDGTDSRWRAEFEHQKVRYFIVMNGLKQQEVEKIVKNLHFY